MKRKNPFQPKTTHALNKHYDPDRTPRRRAYDVVMWMEGDEYCIYDGVTDHIHHYHKSRKYDAIKKFNDIKNTNDSLPVIKI